MLSAQARTIARGHLSGMWIEAASNHPWRILGLWLYKKIRQIEKCLAAPLNTECSHDPTILPLSICHKELKTRIQLLVQEYS
jgi:hypothetical protein